VIRALFVCISLLTTLSTIAQDTTHFRPKLISPQLYWDYGKTATYWTNFESKTELGLGLLILDNYELSAEYGFATLHPDNAFENIDYTVDGSYYRIGMGYMGNVDPKNRIGLEFRYASGQFEDHGTIQYITNSGYNDPYVSNFSRPGLNANWMELNLVTQRYLVLKKSEPEHWLNKKLSIGVKFRYRKKLSATKLDEIPDYYAIPGFGRATAKSLLAVNFFLKLNI
jgi:hypothetical protein